jgi:16S rRNA (cytosine967-C5)-methyltransferase
MTNPRQLAFDALQNIYRRGAYSDIALDRVLRQAKLNSADRALVTELVYGIVRRQRSLDAIIDRLGKKKASQQPPDLRIVFHIGLYQLRYLDRISASAAVDTSVELAKANNFKSLAGVVNGLLRQYERLVAQDVDPLELPHNPIERLGS